MALNRPFRTFQLVPSSARTSSGNSGTIIYPYADIQNLVLRLNVTAASGTSPTLDVIFQQSFDNGTNWVDVARFSQITGTTANPHYICLSVGTNDRVTGAVGDNTISAGTVGVALVSPVWRVRWIIGGTSPSFTFVVDSFAN